MTDSEQLLGLFRDSGALLEGHFQLSSGLHSSRYLQCALVLEDPARAALLGEKLAAAVTASLAAVATSLAAGTAPDAAGDGVSGASIDSVLSPALGGLIIGHEVARALGVKHRFTERDAAAHAVLRRGFQLRPGERVLVIEDVVTTGLSTREVIAVAEATGAKVVAVGSIVDRSGGRAGFSVPFSSLITLDVPAMQPDSCDLCRAGSPAVKPGSRKQ